MTEGQTDIGHTKPQDGNTAEGVRCKGGPSHLIDDEHGEGEEKRRLKFESIRPLE